jgi:site-specific recombinase XerD
MIPRTPGRAAHGQTAHGSDPDAVFLLTEKGVLAMNPAREVKTERFSRTEGKTPAFVEGEVQTLLAAIEASTHTGLRDRALLGVLAYTFARIGAVVNLKVEDYYPSGKRFLLRFKEKGGKEKELPVHHKLEELLDEYLKATGLGAEPGSPLFPAALGKTGKLSRRELVRTDAADMLKRRLRQARLPAHYSPHSFRATGITNFLENDGTLEAAQRIAGHADSRTTKLYDRRGQKVLLEDMERISVLISDCLRDGTKPIRRDESMPRNQVFTRYSHQDTKWRKDLEKHLNSTRRLNRHPAHGETINEQLSYWNRHL